MLKHTHFAVAPVYVDGIKYDCRYVDVYVEDGKFEHVMSRENADVEQVETTDASRFSTRVIIGSGCAAPVRDYPVTLMIVCDGQRMLALSDMMRANDRAVVYWTLGLPD